jgi:hypothetical protein
MDYQYLPLNAVSLILIDQKARPNHVLMQKKKPGAVMSLPMPTTHKDTVSVNMLGYPLAWSELPNILTAGSPRHEDLGWESTEWRTLYWSLVSIAQDLGLTSLSQGAGWASF